MAAPTRGGSKRTINALQLDEISIVDKGANSLANISLIKRDDQTRQESEVRKGGLVDLVTDVVDGHQHGIYIDCYCGEVDVWLASAADSEGNTHDHSLVRSDTGALLVTESNGHSHNIDMDAVNAYIISIVVKDSNGSISADQVSLNLNNGTKESEQMTKEEKAALEKLEKAQEENEAKVKKMEQIIGLPADQRAHFDTLKEADQDAFLAKSDRERKNDVAGAESSVEKSSSATVIYTDRFGQDYTSQDDVKLVNLAKRSDQEHKEASEKAATAQDEVYKSQAAGEFKHLPGDIETRVALIKAVDGIPDPTEREKARQALKAQNANLAKAAGVIGSSSAPEVENLGEDGALTKESATAKLKELATEHMANVTKSGGKPIDMHKAMTLMAEANPLLKKAAYGIPEQKAA